MEFNPYEPPIEPEQPSVASAESVRGPWRDGKSLVVRLDKPNLPRLCPVTLAQEGMTKVTLNASALRPGVWPRLSIGCGIALFVARRWIVRAASTDGLEDGPLSIVLGVVSLILVFWTQRRVELRIPISAELSSRYTGQVKLSRNAVVVTAVVVFTLMVALILALMFARSPIAGWTSLILVFVSVGTLLVLGLVAVIRSQKRVRIEKVRGEYAWLKNVHPGYLEELPHWAGMPTSP